MYRIGIFFVLCFGISVGISAMESPNKHIPPAHRHTPPKSVEKPTAATAFHKETEQIKVHPPATESHKEAEQVKIKPPVVIPPSPTCNRGEHLKNGHCVTDVVISPPTVRCPENAHLTQEECVKNTPQPDCGRREHLENGHCIADVVHPSPTVQCPENTHVARGECVKNTPQLLKPSVEKNNPSFQKNAEQFRKNANVPTGKSTEHHSKSEMDKPHKNSGKVQPCNGGFIPVEEECTPSTLVKPVIAADDFAKRMGIAYCKENPEECGVVSMEKFKAALNEGIAYCKKDPLLCGLYSREQIEAAKKEGIAQCQKFPSLCGLTRLETVATPK